jgi:hypothetical protein
MSVVSGRWELVLVLLVVAALLPVHDRGAEAINDDQNDASGEDSGAVYIHTRSGTTWNPAYVKVSKPKPAAQSRISVALDGDGRVPAAGATRGISAAENNDKLATNAGTAYD